MTLATDLDWKSILYNLCRISLGAKCHCCTVFNHCLQFCPPSYPDSASQLTSQSSSWRKASPSTAGSVVQAVGSAFLPEITCLPSFISQKCIRNFALLVFFSYKSQHFEDYILFLILTTVCFKTRRRNVHSACHFELEEIYSCNFIVGGVLL